MVPQVLGIAEALTTKNTTVTELDLNSNACGVRGEIALNDMMMSKPELYVEWKDASSESTWNIDEIQQIIQHYGVSDVRAGGGCRARILLCACVLVWGSTLSHYVGWLANDIDLVQYPSWLLAGPVDREL